MNYESCCTCSERESKHELTQDRIDVDLYHYCCITGERLYEDIGKKKGCVHWIEGIEIGDD
jgi:hypothetical protein